MSKTFPGTRALDGVDLSIEQGQILALLGGNGSGKSTLIKILAGILPADRGGSITRAEVTVPASGWTSTLARRANLHFVHQHLGIFPDLTVAENIAIGRGFDRGPFGNIRWGRVRRRTREILDRFGIETTPRALVRNLRPADRTMVAIARALQDQEGDHDAILFLDEPTASLPAAEVEILHAALRRYANAGQTIVYVTHRLDEVGKIADRVAVLRDGQVVANFPVSELDERKLVEHIMGRPVAAHGPPSVPPTSTSSDSLLSVRHLSIGPLRDVSFELSRGEVLGVAGLLGSGRTELLRSLFGAEKATGVVRLDGEERRFRSARAAMAAGVAYVPEDRQQDAMFTEMTVRENLSAASIRSYWRGVRLRKSVEQADAVSMIDRYSIKTPSDTVPIWTLSGGNQQKAILARWLSRRPRLLLLDEPTQGVDVGARADIYSFVREATGEGASVIVASSDFEELASICDRVIVLREGVVSGALEAPALTAHRLTEMAYLSHEERAS